MSYQFLQLEQQGQVAYVWLNRPELHNAFNTTVIEELHACFKQINTRDDIRVVVLAGRGKSFSAGADLNWMKQAGQASSAENEADALKLAQMLASLIMAVTKATVQAQEPVLYLVIKCVLIALRVFLYSPQKKFTFVLS